MDTPIINPIYIYLMDMLPKIGTAIIVIAAIAIIACFIAIFIISDEYGLEGEDEKKKVRKVFKVLVFSVVFIILSLLIPSKETMMTMYVASKITPNTIESSKENVEELVDYIIAKVKEIEK